MGGVQHVFEVFAVAELDGRPGVGNGCFKDFGGEHFGGGGGFAHPVEQVGFAGAHGAEAYVEGHPTDADDGSKAGKAHHGADYPAEHGAAGHAHHEHHGVEKPLSFCLYSVGL